MPLEAARDLLLRGVHGLVAHGAAARHLGAALDQLHAGAGAVTGDWALYVARARTGRGLATLVSSHSPRQSCQRTFAKFSQCPAKAPTKAFSFVKVSTSALTIKTL